MIPDEVAAAWGWSAGDFAPVAGGLINATFVVRPGSPGGADRAPVAAVQRLHPVFGADVNLDLEAVTAHVAARGLETPRLLRTRDGRACVVHDGKVWRATTWVDGESVHRVPDRAWAAAGGVLVARFHRAVADLDYDYKFVRRGVHDTAKHVATLAMHVAGASAVGTDADADARSLGEAIADAARGLPAMPALPLRHIHGDLKISNLLFRRDPLRGVALVDLDTLQKGTLAYELGDAMRSWCNPSGEDAGQVAFDRELFAAAIGAYREAAGELVSAAERRGIVVGLETVCVELAARFATDVFEDRYFGWDAARFPSRRAHNLVRARGQLALALAVRAERDVLYEIAVG